MGLKNQHKNQRPALEASSSEPRKDVYMYHDYRMFLNDEIKHRTQTLSGFSMRSLARDSGIAPGHLSMVLSGKKKISADKLIQLARALSLKPAEQNHLTFLQSLNDASSQENRISALARLQRSIAYQMKNRSEHHVYRYLSRWFYVVIREMAAHPGFKADAKWIQDQLQFPVSLSDLKQALEFLISNNYIQIQADGLAKASSENIYCTGEVYQIILSQFHKEMFEIAIRSLDLMTGKERYLEGYTCALSQAQFEQAQRIISRAIDEIEDLEKLASAETPKDNIYHFCFFGIPLLKTTKKEQSE